MKQITHIIQANIKEVEQNFACVTEPSVPILKKT